MKIVRRSTLVFNGLIAAVLAGAGVVIGLRATAMGAWLGLVPVAVVGWYTLRRPWRRWRAARRPLPEGAEAWLERHVPYYHDADATARARFARDVRFVLDEWAFEGVGGAVVEDVHRVGVAAGAALLLAGRPEWELPSRQTVLFYPGSFDDDYMPGDAAAFDGMAHAQGPVIVSLEAFTDGWARTGDGQNVVLHELAHLLDYENTYADGTPALIDSASAPAWQQLVRREMQRAKVGRSLLRRYAATNPAELFAVAIENYFDRPHLLRRRHPELYDALSAMLGLDLAPPQDDGLEAASADEDWDDAEGVA